MARTSTIHLRRYSRPGKSGAEGAFVLTTGLSFMADLQTKDEMHEVLWFLVESVTSPNGQHDQLDPWFIPWVGWFYRQSHLIAVSRL